MLVRLEITSSEFAVKSDSVISMTKIVTGELDEVLEVA